MRPELLIHPVEDIRFSGPCRLDGSRLYVEQGDLKALVQEEGRVRPAGAAVLRHGERAWAMPVLDKVERRAKGDPICRKLGGKAG